MDLAWNLPPEKEKGNTEYKLLVDASPGRLQSLQSQMRYRLVEGHGKAIYWVGIRDNGWALGLPADLLQRSIDQIKTIASENKAIATVDQIINVGSHIPERVHHRLQDRLETAAGSNRFISKVTIQAIDPSTSAPAYFV